MARCPACGHENEEGARFCSACGNPFEPTSGPGREVRKVVTVLFSDVIGSTSLGEQLDPESLRRLMGQYFEEMKQALEGHGGTVEKFIGDAVMAVFGIPTLHEDDALRAVRAAVEMKERLDRLNRDIERDRGFTIMTRTGINTGEVVAGDQGSGQTLVTGDAVNVAARLEQAAKPGEILLGEATQRLLRDAVRADPIDALSLKGKGEPVAAYRLVEIRPDAEAVRRRIDSPMVGRDRQLGLLEQTLQAAIDDRSCHLFTVIGSPGVGKSRLIQEFVTRVSASATVLRGRCLPYGEGITYWPVAEMVKQAAGITEDDPPEAATAKVGTIVSMEEGNLVSKLLLQAMGFAAGEASAEEIAWGFRKFLEQLALGRPVLVIFDDIHWAEPTLLDLIDHIADWSKDAPILLATVARQELLDVRSGWAGGKRNATTIQLEPLTERECEQLVENLLGMALLPEVSKSRIAEAAEGNPLFVEQVLSMLIDDELLRRDNGHWIPTADLTTIPIPPTIHALLAARLDRLEGKERQVIERASVVGKVFYQGAVRELAPESLQPEVGSHLLTLVRKEFIRPDRSDFARESAFRFRHLLIRDAAYGGMPKEIRAQLHESFASWLERASGERRGEYEEVLGYHLEQAHRYHTELGAADVRTAELGRRAADLLAGAGHRARQRFDMSAASSLIGRSIELLPPDDPSVPDLRLDLADVLHDLGEFSRAEQILTDLLDAARARGDRALELRARVMIGLRTDRTTSWEGETATAEEAVAFFEETGDHRGLYDAYRLLAAISWTHGHAGQAEAELMKLLEHATASGRNKGFLLHWLAGTLIWGPTPAQEGLRRCDELLAQVAGSRLAEGSILTVRGALLAMVGHIDEGREWGARGRAILMDLGGVVPTMAAASRVGLMERVIGDLDRAEQVMRPSVEILLRMGDRAFLSTLAPQLGRVLAEKGNLDEGEELARIGMDLAPPDDWASQVTSRVATALVLALRGDVDGAERFLREALAMSEDVDYIGQMADVWSDLAKVLQSTGRLEEAASALRKALSLQEAKGNILSAGRTREKLAQLEGS